MSKEIKGRKPKNGNITHVCVKGEGWVAKSEIIKRIGSGVSFLL